MKTTYFNRYGDNIQFELISENEIEIASGKGTISSKRPAELRTQPPVTPPQEQPTFVAATEAAQTGTATGGTIVDTSAAGTSGGVSTGGEFDQIAFINQGQNAI